MASKKQREKQIGKQIYTKILPLGKWTNAEDYHQKYYLRGTKRVMKLLSFKSDSELRDSPIATRLNGFVTGKGTKEQFEKELLKWDLSKEVKKQLSSLLTRF